MTKPTIPLHDKRFAWIPAASHSTSEAFRQRQLERIRAAQSATASPAIPIRKRRSA
jgi:hypothetical protein